MSSVSRSIRILAVGVVASGLSLVAAQPAMAFSDPTPTFTATPAHPDERPLLTLLASCPTGSLSVKVDRNGTGTDGNPYSVSSTQNLDGSGEWTDSFYDDQFFLRGTTYTYVVNCFDGLLVAGVPSGANTGTVSVGRLAVDSNAVLTAPATVAVDTATTASGDCGNSSNIATYDWRLYDNSSNQIDAQFNIPYNPAGYTIPIPSGASNGFVAGDSYNFVVYCDSTSPSAHVASARSVLITFTAAAVAGAALPSMGFDLVPPLVASSVLLFAGAALVLLRRRRAAPLG